MSQRMDEFREFVNRYPKLRDEVASGRRTWQNIYEEWVLYGEGESFLKFKGEPIKEAVTTNGNHLLINMDSLKNVIGYIQKINPDSLNKTLNTVQKVIQIAQTVGGNKASSLPVAGSIFSDWWD